MTVIMVQPVDSKASSGGCNWDIVIDSAVWIFLSLKHNVQFDTQPKHSSHRRNKVHLQHPIIDDQYIRENPAVMTRGKLNSLTLQELTCDVVHNPAPVCVHVCPFICKMDFRLISDFKKCINTCRRRLYCYIPEKQVWTRASGNIFQGKPTQLLWIFANSKDSERKWVLHDSTHMFCKWTGLYIWRKTLLLSLVESDWVWLYEIMKLYCFKGRQMSTTHWSTPQRCR